MDLKMCYDNVRAHLKGWICSSLTSAWNIRAGLQKMPLSAGRIPRCDNVKKKSPVCTTIIVFSTQLLLCQTNDFLPFVHKSCAGFACRKLEREKAAVFRFSPFSPDYRNLLRVCSAMNAFPEPQTISPENSCVERLWFSMCLCVLACSPTPSPFSANGTVHLKRRLSSLNALCPFNSQLRGAHFTGAVLAL